MTSMETSELLQLEKQFWDAMKRKDGAAAERLTAEECIVVGRQGVSAINRAMMSNLTVEGQWTLQDFELDEGSLQVKMLADDVASVASKVTNVCWSKARSFRSKQTTPRFGCEKTASGDAQFIPKR